MYRAALVVGVVKGLGSDDDDVCNKSSITCSTTLTDICISFPSKQVTGEKAREREREKGMADLSPLCVLQAG